MNAEEYQKLLARLGACNEARVEAQNKSLKAVWETCNRGDWMLWLLAKLVLDRKLLVELCCDCAEPALKYVPVDEYRPAEAIRIARLWVADKATIEEVTAAASAAEAASPSAAAWAASWEASRAAASAAAWATSWEATAAARADSLLYSANLIRAKVSYEMVLQLAIRK